MSAAQFDTLTYAKKLREAGFTDQQAEAQAEALRAVVEENLATRRDIKELEASIKSLETATRRDIKELEAATRRDIKELEAATRRDIGEAQAGLSHEIELVRRDVELVRRDVLIKLGGIVVAGFAVMAALLSAVIAMIQLA